MHKPFLIAGALMIAGALVAFQATTLKRQRMHLSTISDEVLSVKMLTVETETLSTISDEVLSVELQNVETETSAEILTSDTGAKNIFSFQMKPLSIGDSCVDNADCIGDLKYCQTQNSNTLPTQGYCYECVNQNHCKDPLSTFCDISYSGAYCTSPKVREIPGFSRMQTGYNVYKGDPLYILESIGGPRDAGYAPYKFYHHQFDTHINNEVTLENEVFSHPKGFYAEGNGAVCNKASKTNTITSTSSYEEEVKKQVTYGATGTIKGVDLAGSVGSGSYDKVKEDAMDTKTTTFSSDVCTLYDFYMEEDTKKEIIMGSLHENAKKRLKNLTTLYDWTGFFDDYGTHIITKGTAGAFQRLALTFTESERSELTAEGKTFENSMTIGMPGVFGFSRTSNGSTNSAFATSIRNMKSSMKGVSGGDMTNLLNSPDLILKTLDPICEFIDNLDICYDMLKKYCVGVLQAKGFMSAHECAYPKESIYSCADSRDCPKGEGCNSGRCVQGHCSDRSDCDTGEGCKNGKCKYMHIPNCDRCDKYHQHKCLMYSGAEHKLCPAPWYIAGYKDDGCWPWELTTVCKIDSYCTVCPKTEWGSALNQCRFQDKVRGCKPF